MSGLLPDFVGCELCVLENVKKESGDEVFLFGTVVDEFVSSFGCAYVSCEVWMSPHRGEWFFWFFFWELYLQL